MVEPGSFLSTESAVVAGCEDKEAGDPFKPATAGDPLSLVFGTDQTSESDVKTQADLLEKPTRPLSAYNLFFRDQREQLIQALPAQECRTSNKNWRRKKQPHHKIGFSNLAKTIASRWRDIDKDLKAYYEAIAEEGRRAYNRRVRNWRDQREALGLPTKKNKKKVKKQAPAPKPKAVAGVENDPTGGQAGLSRQENRLPPYTAPFTDHSQATTIQTNHSCPLPVPYHHPEKAVRLQLPSREETFDPRLEPLPYDYSGNCCHFDLASGRSLKQSGLEVPVSRFSSASHTVQNMQTGRSPEILVRDDSWTEPFQDFQTTTDVPIQDQGNVQGFPRRTVFHKAGGIMGPNRYESRSESSRQFGWTDPVDPFFSPPSNPQYHASTPVLVGATQFPHHESSMRSLANDLGPDCLPLYGRDFNVRP
eukprot:scaffold7395_cov175-Amphora_coffeaeformis.AAC.1